MRMKPPSFKVLGPVSRVILLNWLGLLAAQGGGGTVVSWGSDVAGKTNIPAGLNDVIAVAAGLDHGLALRENGTVVAWGDNGSGQIDVPPFLSDVVAVSSGWSFSMALRADGTVVTWGYPSTVVPLGLSNVVAIAAGGSQFCLALRADRTVVAWGYNGSGQTSVPPGLSNIVAIAAGLEHSLALRDDGTVVVWGGNVQGESIAPAGLSNVVAIAGGWGQSLALKEDGTAVRWGGSGSFSASNVVAMAGGWDAWHEVLFRDGTVLNGPTGLSNVISISRGHFFALAATGAGRPTLTVENLPSRTLPAGASELFSVRTAGAYPMNYQWQFNGADLNGATNWFLRVGDLQPTHSGTYQVTVSNAAGSVTSSSAVLTVLPAAPSVVVQPADITTWRGNQAVFSVAAWGSSTRTYQWRFNSEDIPDATNSVLVLTNVQHHQTGGYDIIIANTMGAATSRVATLTLSPVVAWGENWSGKTLVPPTVSNAMAIAAGANYSMALRPGGTIALWGFGFHGLSNELASLTGVIAIASGSSHVLALRADGAVVAHGYNGYGQTNVPSDLQNAVAIAAGYNFSAALQADGIVKAWGAHEAGQTNVPPGLNNVVAISCGQAHVLALRADGTVALWGANYAPTNVPTGLTGVTAIAAGRFHNLALRSDGTVAAWGYGGNGQTAVPVGLSNVVAIAGGNNHSVALLRDGTIRAWGWNGSGQTDVPPGLSNVLAIASGTDHCLALLGESPPEIRPLLERPVKSAGSFQVSLRTRSGRVYSLEHTPSLSNSNWTPLPLVPGNGGLQVLVDPTATSAQRYYRVTQW